MENGTMEVLQINQFFCKAFEDYDIKMVEEVWSGAEYVRCVHPGWNTLIGWDEIKQSWEAIFSNSTTMKFDLHDIQVDISKVEGITSDSAEGSGNSNVVVTNVFERTGAGWQTILHQGSFYTFPDRTSQYN